MTETVSSGLIVIDYPCDQSRMNEPNGFDQCDMLSRKSSQSPVHFLSSSNSQIEIPPHMHDVYRSHVVEMWRPTRIVLTGLWVLSFLSLLSDILTASKVWGKEHDIYDSSLLLTLFSIRFGELLLLSAASWHIFTVVGKLLLPSPKIATLLDDTLTPTVIAENIDLVLIEIARPARILTVLSFFVACIHSIHSYICFSMNSSMSLLMWVLLMIAPACVSHKMPYTSVTLSIVAILFYTLLVVLITQDVHPFPGESSSIITSSLWGQRFSDFTFVDITCTSLALITIIFLRAYLTYIADKFSAQAYSIQYARHSQHMLSHSLLSHAMPSCLLPTDTIIPSNNYTLHSSASVLVFSIDYTSVMEQLPSSLSFTLLTAITTLVDACQARYRAHGAVLVEATTGHYAILCGDIAGHSQRRHAQVLCALACDIHAAMTAVLPQLPYGIAVHSGSVGSVLLGSVAPQLSLVGEVKGIALALAEGEWRKSQGPEEKGCVISSETRELLSNRTIDSEHDAAFPEMEFILRIIPGDNVPFSESIYLMGREETSASRNPPALTYFPDCRTSSGRIDTPISTLPSSSSPLAYCSYSQPSASLADSIPSLPTTSAAGPALLSSSPHRASASPSPVPPLTPDSERSIDTTVMPRLVSIDAHAFISLAWSGAVRDGLMDGRLLEAVVRHMCVLQAYAQYTEEQARKEEQQKDGIEGNYVPGEKYTGNSGILTKNPIFPRASSGPDVSILSHTSTSNMRVMKSRLGTHVSFEAFSGETGYAGSSVVGEIPSDSLASPLRNDTVGGVVTSAVGMNGDVIDAAHALSRCAPLSQTPLLPLQTQDLRRDGGDVGARGMDEKANEGKQAMVAIGEAEAGTEVGATRTEVGATRERERRSGCAGGMTCADVSPTSAHTRSHVSNTAVRSAATAAAATGAGVVSGVGAGADVDVGVELCESVLNIVDDVKDVTNVSSIRDIRMSSEFTLPHHTSLRSDDVILRSIHSLPYSELSESAEGDESLGSMFIPVAPCATQMGIHAAANLNLTTTVSPTVAATGGTVATSDIITPVTASDPSATSASAPADALAAQHMGTNGDTQTHTLTHLPAHTRDHTLPPDSCVTRDFSPLGSKSLGISPDSLPLQDFPVVPPAALASFLCAIPSLYPSSHPSCSSPRSLASPPPFTSSSLSPGAAPPPIDAEDVDVLSRLVPQRAFKENIKKTRAISLPRRPCGSLSPRLSSPYLSDETPHPDISRDLEDLEFLKKRNIRAGENSGASLSARSYGSFVPSKHTSKAAIHAERTSAPHHVFAEPPRKRLRAATARVGTEVRGMATAPVSRVQTATSVSTTVSHTHSHIHTRTHANQHAHTAALRTTSSSDVSRPGSESSTLTSRIPAHQPSRDTSILDLQSFHHGSRVQMHHPDDSMCPQAMRDGECALSLGASVGNPRWSFGGSGSAVREEGNNSRIGDDVLGSGGGVVGVEGDIAARHGPRAAIATVVISGMSSDDSSVEDAALHIIYATSMSKPSRYTGSDAGSHEEEAHRHSLQGISLNHQHNDMHRSMGGSSGTKRPRDRTLGRQSSCGSPRRFIPDANGVGADMNLRLHAELLQKVNSEKRNSWKNSSFGIREDFFGGDSPLRLDITPSDDAVISLSPVSSTSRDAVCSDSQGKLFARSPSARKSHRKPSSARVSTTTPRSDVHLHLHRHNTFTFLPDVAAALPPSPRCPHSHTGGSAGNEACHHCPIERVASSPGPGASLAPMSTSSHPSLAPPRPATHTHTHTPVLIPTQTSPRSLSSAPSHTHAQQHPHANASPTPTREPDITSVCPQPLRFHTSFSLSQTHTRSKVPRSPYSPFQSSTQTFYTHAPHPLSRPRSESHRGSNVVANSISEKNDMMRGISPSQGSVNVDVRQASLSPERLTPKKGPIPKNRKNSETLLMSSLLPVSHLSLDVSGSHDQPVLHSPALSTASPPSACSPSSPPTPCQSLSPKKRHSRASSRSTVRVPASATIRRIPCIAQRTQSAIHSLDSVRTKFAAVRHVHSREPPRPDMYTHTSDERTANFHSHTQAAMRQVVCLSDGAMSGQSRDSYFGTIPGEVSPEHSGAQTPCTPHTAESEDNGRESKNVVVAVSSSIPHISVLADKQVPPVLVPAATPISAPASVSSCLPSSSSRPSMSPFSSLSPNSRLLRGDYYINRAHAHTPEHTPACSPLTPSLPAPGQPASSPLLLSSLSLNDPATNTVATVATTAPATTATNATPAASASDPSARQRESCGYYIIAGAPVGVVSTEEEEDEPSNRGTRTRTAGVATDATDAHPRVSTRASTSASTAPHVAMQAEVGAGNGGKPTSLSGHVAGVAREAEDMGDRRDTRLPTYCAIASVPVITASDESPSSDNDDDDGAKVDYVGKGVDAVGGNRDSNGCEHPPSRPFAVKKSKSRDIGIPQDISTPAVKKDDNLPENEMTHSENPDMGSKKDIPAVFMDANSLGITLPAGAESGLSVVLSGSSSGNSGSLISQRTLPELVSSFGSCISSIPCLTIPSSHEPSSPALSHHHRHVFRPVPAVSVLTVGDISQLTSPSHASDISSLIHPNTLPTSTTAPANSSTLALVPHPHPLLAFCTPPRIEHASFTHLDGPSLPLPFLISSSDPARATPALAPTPRPPPAIYSHFESSHVMLPYPTPVITLPSLPALSTPASAPPPLAAAVTPTVNAPSSTAPTHAGQASASSRSICVSLATPLPSSRLYTHDDAHDVTLPSPSTPTHAAVDALSGVRGLVVVDIAADSAHPTVARHHAGMRRSSVCSTDNCGRPSPPSHTTEAAVSHVLGSSRSPSRRKEATSATSTALGADVTVARYSSNCSGPSSHCDDPHSGHLSGRPINGSLSGKCDNSAHNSSPSASSHGHSASAPTAGSVCHLGSTPDSLSTATHSRSLPSHSRNASNTSFSLIYISEHSHRSQHSHHSNHSCRSRPSLSPPPHAHTALRAIASVPVDGDTPGDVAMATGAGVGNADTAGGCAGGATAGDAAGDGSSAMFVSNRRASVSVAAAGTAVSSENNTHTQEHISENAAPGTYSGNGVYVGAPELCEGEGCGSMNVHAYTADEHDRVLGVTASHSHDSSLPSPSLPLPLSIPAPSQRHGSSHGSASGNDNHAALSTPSSPFFPATSFPSSPPASPSSSSTYSLSCTPSPTKSTPIHPPHLPSFPFLAHFAHFSPPQDIAALDTAAILPSSTYTPLGGYPMQPSAPLFATHPHLLPSLYNGSGNEHAGDAEVSSGGAAVNSSSTTDRSVSRTYHHNDRPSGHHSCSSRSRTHTRSRSRANTNTTRAHTHADDEDVDFPEENEYMISSANVAVDSDSTHTTLPSDTRTSSLAPSLAASVLHTHSQSDALTVLSSSCFLPTASRALSTARGMHSTHTHTNTDTDTDIPARAYAHDGARTQPHLSHSCRAAASHLSSSTFMSSSSLSSALRLAAASSVRQSPSISALSAPSSPTPPPHAPATPIPRLHAGPSASFHAATFSTDPTSTRSAFTNTSAHTNSSNANANTLTTVRTASIGNVGLSLRIPGTSSSHTYNPSTPTLTTQNSTHFPHAQRGGSSTLHTTLSQSIPPTTILDSSRTPIDTAFASASGSAAASASASPAPTAERGLHLSMYPLPSWSDGHNQRASLLPTFMRTCSDVQGYLPSHAHTHAHHSHDQNTHGHGMARGHGHIDVRDYSDTRGHTHREVPLRECRGDAGLRLQGYASNDHEYHATDRMSAQSSTTRASHARACPSSPNAHKPPREAVDKPSRVATTLSLPLSPSQPGSPAQLSVEITASSLHPPRQHQHHHQQQQRDSDEMRAQTSSSSSSTLPLFPSPLHAGASHASPPSPRPIPALAHTLTHKAKLSSRTRAPALPPLPVTSPLNGNSVVYFQNSGKKPSPVSPPHRAAKRPTLRHAHSEHHSLHSGIHDSHDSGPSGIPATVRHFPSSFSHERADLQSLEPDLYGSAVLADNVLSQHDGCNGCAHGPVTRSSNVSDARESNRMRHSDPCDECHTREFTTNTNTFREASPNFPENSGDFYQNIPNRRRFPPHASFQSHYSSADSDSQGFPTLPQHLPLTDYSGRESTNSGAYSLPLFPAAPSHNTSPELEVAYLSPRACGPAPDIGDTGRDCDGRKKDVYVRGHKQDGDIGKETARTAISTKTTDTIFFPLTRQNTEVSSFTPILRQNTWDSSQTMTSKSSSVSRKDRLALSGSLIAKAKTNGGAMVKTPSMGSNSMFSGNSVHSMHDGAGMTGNERNSSEKSSGNISDFPNLGDSGSSRMLYTPDAKISSISRRSTAYTPPSLSTSLHPSSSFASLPLYSSPIHAKHTISSLSPSSSSLYSPLKGAPAAVALEADQSGMRVSPACVAYNAEVSHAHVMQHPADIPTHTHTHTTASTCTSNTGTNTTPIVTKAPRAIATPQTAASTPISTSASALDALSLDVYPLALMHSSHSVHPEGNIYAPISPGENPKTIRLPHHSRNPEFPHNPKKLWFSSHLSPVFSPPDGDEELEIGTSTSDVRGTGHHSAHEQTEAKELLLDGMHASTVFACGSTAPTHSLGGVDSAMNVWNPDPLPPPPLPPSPDLTTAYADNHATINTRAYSNTTATTPSTSPITPTASMSLPLNNYISPPVSPANRLHHPSTTTLRPATVPFASVPLSPSHGRVGGGFGANAKVMSHITDNAYVEELDTHPYSSYYDRDYASSSDFVSDSGSGSDSDTDTDSDSVSDNDDDEDAEEGIDNISFNSDASSSDLTVLPALYMHLPEPKPNDISREAMDLALFNVYFKSRSLTPVMEEEEEEYDCIGTGFASGVSAGTGVASARRDNSARHVSTHTHEPYNHLSKPPLGPLPHDEDGSRPHTPSDSHPHTIPSTTTHTLTSIDCHGVNRDGGDARVAGNDVSPSSTLSTALMTPSWPVRDIPTRASTSVAPMPLLLPLVPSREGSVGGEENVCVIDCLPTSGTGEREVGHNIRVGGAGSSGNASSGADVLSGRTGNSSSTSGYASPEPEDEEEVLLRFTQACLLEDLRRSPEAEEMTHVGPEFKDIPGRLSGFGGIRGSFSARISVAASAPRADSALKATMWDIGDADGDSSHGEAVQGAETENKKQKKGARKHKRQKKAGKRAMRCPHEQAMDRKGQLFYPVGCHSNTNDANNDNDTTLPAKMVSSATTGGKNIEPSLRKVSDGGACVHNTSNESPLLAPVPLPPLPLLSIRTFMFPPLLPPIAQPAPVNSRFVLLNVSNVDECAMPAGNTNPGNPTFTFPLSETSSHAQSTQDTPQHTLFPTQYPSSTIHPSILRTSSCFSSPHLASPTPALCSAALSPPTLFLPPWDKKGSTFVFSPLFCSQEHDNGSVMAMSPYLLPALAVPSHTHSDTDTTRTRTYSRSSLHGRASDSGAASRRVGHSGSSSSSDRLALDSGDSDGPDVSKNDNSGKIMPNTSGISDNNYGMQHYRHTSFTSLAAPLNMPDYAYMQRLNPYQSLHKESSLPSTLVNVLKRLPLLAQTLPIDTTAALRTIWAGTAHAHWVHATHPAKNTGFSVEVFPPPSRQGSASAKNGVYVAPSMPTDIDLYSDTPFSQYSRPSPGNFGSLRNFQGNSGRDTLSGQTSDQSMYDSHIDTSSHALTSSTARTTREHLPCPPPALLHVYSASSSLGSSLACYSPLTPPIDSAGALPDAASASLASSSSITATVAPSVVSAGAIELTDVSSPTVLCFPSSTPSPDPCLLPGPLARARMHHTPSVDTYDSQLPLPGAVSQCDAPLPTLADPPHAHAHTDPLSCSSAYANAALVRTHAAATGADSGSSITPDNATGRLGRVGSVGTVEVGILNLEGPQTQHPHHTHAHSVPAFSALTLSSLQHPPGKSSPHLPADLSKLLNSLCLCFHISDDTRVYNPCTTSAHILPNTPTDEPHNAPCRPCQPRNSENSPNPDNSGNLPSEMIASLEQTFRQTLFLSFHTSFKYRLLIAIVATLALALPYLISCEFSHHYANGNVLHIFHGDFVAIFAYVVAFLLVLSIIWLNSKVYLPHRASSPPLAGLYEVQNHLTEQDNKQDTLPLHPSPYSLLPPSPSTSTLPPSRSTTSTSPTPPPHGEFNLAVYKSLFGCITIVAHVAIVILRAVDLLSTCLGFILLLVLFLTFFSFCPYPIKSTGPLILSLTLHSIVWVAYNAEVSIQFRTSYIIATLLLSLTASTNSYLWEHNMRLTFLRSLQYTLGDAYNYNLQAQFFSPASLWPWVYQEVVRAYTHTCTAAAAAAVNGSDNGGAGVGVRDGVQLHDTAMHECGPLQSAAQWTDLDDSVCDPTPAYTTTTGAAVLGDVYLHSPHTLSPPTTPAHTPPHRMRSLSPTAAPPLPPREPLAALAPPHPLAPITIDSSARSLCAPSPCPTPTSPTSSRYSLPSARALSPLSALSALSPRLTRSALSSRHLSTLPLVAHATDDSSPRLTPTIFSTRLPRPTVPISPGLTPFSSLQSSPTSSHASYVFGTGALNTSRGSFTGNLTARSTSPLSQLALPSLLSHAHTHMGGLMNATPLTTIHSSSSSSSSSTSSSNGQSATPSWSSCPTACTPATSSTAHLTTAPHAHSPSLPTRLAAICEGDDGSSRSGACDENSSRFSANILHEAMGVREDARRTDTISLSIPMSSVAAPVRTHAPAPAPVPALSSTRIATVLDASLDLSKLSAELSTVEMASFLDLVYTIFDECAERRGITKLYTQDHHYIACTNLTRAILPQFCANSEFMPDVSAVDPPTRAAMSQDVENLIWFAMDIAFYLSFLPHPLVMKTYQQTYLSTLASLQHTYSADTSSSSIYPDPLTLSPCQLQHCHTTALAAVTSIRPLSVRIGVDTGVITISPPVIRGCTPTITSPALSGARTLLKYGCGTSITLSDAAAALLPSRFVVERVASMRRKPFSGLPMLGYSYRHQCPDSSSQYLRGSDPDGNDATRTLFPGSPTSTAPFTPASPTIDPAHVSSRSHTANANDASAAPQSPPSPTSGAPDVDLSAYDHCMGFDSAAYYRRCRAHRWLTNEAHATGIYAQSASGKTEFPDYGVGGKNTDRVLVHFPQHKDTTATDVYQMRGHANIPVKMWLSSDVCAVWPELGSTITSAMW